MVSMLSRPTGTTRAWNVRSDVLPTVFMNDRIMKALGKECAAALQEEVQTTSFTVAREAALYCARTPKGFVSFQTPGIAQRRDPKKGGSSN